MECGEPYERRVGTRMQNAWYVFSSATIQAAIILTWDSPEGKHVVYSRLNIVVMLDRI